MLAISRTNEADIFMPAKVTLTIRAEPDHQVIGRGANWNAERSSCSSGRALTDASSTH